MYEVHSPGKVWHSAAANLETLKKCLRRTASACSQDCSYFL